MKNCLWDEKRPRKRAAKLKLWKNAIKGSIGGTMFKSNKVIVFGNYETIDVPIYNIICVHVHVCAPLYTDA